MRIVTTSQDLTSACQRLSDSDFVAVDTEFMREQTFWPQLCLVQLASPEDAFILDPMAPGLDLAPFWSLMANESVAKVFHAARQDIEIVFAKTGLVPRPVFDTQIAAMVCGFGESISYVNLVKKVTGVDLDKSSRFTDWSRRPLSDKQLSYALADVTHLRDVYRHLKSEIDASGRADWLNEEMGVLTDRKTYEQHPDEAWQRLKLRVKNRKALAVLMELAAWRERMAQSQDVPRARILRDEALYDIANQAPTSAEQLSELQDPERRLLALGARPRHPRGRKARPAARHQGAAADRTRPAALGGGDRAHRSAAGAAEGVGRPPSRGAAPHRRCQRTWSASRSSPSPTSRRSRVGGASCSARTRCA